MEGNKFKNLVEDTCLFAISNFGSKILVFLLTPLYTSILSTEEYGVADLITTTINFIYPVLTLAIADATLRFALDKEKNKKKVLSNSLALTFISIVFLMLFYPLLARIDYNIKQYWTVFVVTYALFNIHNCMSSYLKGIGNTKLFAIQGLIQTFTIILSNIFFLIVLKTGLDGYLISIAFGYIVPIFIMLIVGKITKDLFPIGMDFALLKEMLKYSIPMVPTLLAWAINTSIDKYMIIGLVGLSASGVYSVAHKIPTIFTTVMSIFTQAWQISAITNYGSSDESEYHTQIYTGLNIFSLIGCMCVIILSKWLAGFMFAKDFYAAWRYVPFLTVSALFASHGGFLASTFRAAKKTTSLFISVILGSILNVVLNWTFIKLYGTLGAAIATALSFIVVWLFRFILSQKIVKIKINVVSTIISYTLFLVTAIVTTFESNYTYIVSIISLLVIVIINIKDIENIVRVILKSLIKRKGI